MAQWSVGVLMVALLLCSMAQAQTCSLDGMWKTIDSNSTVVGNSTYTADDAVTLDFSWTGSFTGEISVDVAAALNCTVTVQFEGTFELDESDTLTLESDSCNYYNCGGNCSYICGGTACDATKFGYEASLSFNSNCTSFTNENGDVFYKQNSGDSKWWVYAMIGFAGLLVVAISVGIVAVVIYMVIKKKRGDYLTVDQE